MVVGNEVLFGKEYLLRNSLPGPALPLRHTFSAAPGITMNFQYVRYSSLQCKAISISAGNSVWRSGKMRSSCLAAQRHTKIK
ncbi:hypothetical protein PM082_004381 [Marasmius tenuissimus]|nr:hypothetical protein PM082_004381 [Marasmius tenuissimus]